MNIERLAEIITENHLETVERLTRVETQITGIPERVTDLEHFKYKLLGINTALSVFAAGAVAFFKRH